MYEKYVKLRNEKGVTDYRVAKDTGIPRSCIAEWGKGMYQPKFDKIVKLARYFKVPIEYFVDE